MRNLKINSWNVSSLRGSTGEIVATLSSITLINAVCYNLDRRALHQIDHRENRGKDSVYKVFCIGNDEAIGCVYIFLVLSGLEKHVKKSLCQT